MTAGDSCFCELKQRFLSRLPDIFGFNRTPAISLYFLTNDPSFPTEEGTHALKELLELDGQAFEVRAGELLGHFKARLTTIHADEITARDRQGRIKVEQAFSEIKQQTALRDQWRQLSNEELDQLWKRRKKMHPKEAEILRMLIRQRKGIK